MAFKCSMDTYSRYFQFRFIHNILPTNSFLFKIGLIETEKCVFCEESRETIKHLMWDCVVTKTFWDQIVTWVGCELGDHLNINFDIICFGLFNDDFDVFKNMLILLAKRFIYRCRVDEKNPNISLFKEWLKFIEKAERLIAERNNKQSFHNKKWRIWNG